jgi:hypothetical protein
MLTDDQVQTDATIACRTHGSKRVSDAAHAAMAGRYDALHAVGLGYCAGNLPAASLIATTAYALMSDEDQALDLAQASIAAAGITAPRGAPTCPTGDDDAS